MSMIKDSNPVSIEIGPIIITIIIKSHYEKMKRNIFITKIKELSFDLKNRRSIMTLFQNIYYSCLLNGARETIML